MPDPLSLGAAIRARRQALGLTQEALAARVGDGVRQSDISRLERDKITLPHPARVRALARALEMAPGELLTRSGWAGADQPVVPGAAVGAADSPPPAVPPSAPGSGAALTRLGQALLDARATARATERTLAQADLVWAWATDPRACQQPFAAFARDRREGGDRN
jgi:hypothetical protein